MSTQPYAIGVVINSTATRSGIVNRHGEIIGKGSILPTGMYFCLRSFLQALHKALLPVLKKVGHENIKGIGIVAPNRNHHTGIIDYTPYLPWESVVPLTDTAEQVFNLPCKLTNDANAAALAEMIYGAARGIKDFIVIKLDTSVCNSIVSNGELIFGHDSLASKLEHVVVHKDRRHGSTGQACSLEAHSSASGIPLSRGMLLDYWTGSSQSKLCEQEGITLKLLCDCALKGDNLARRVFAYTGEMLGIVLAEFVMFSFPKAIILSGDITRVGQLLMDPIRRHLKSNLPPNLQDKIKLIFSELNNADIGILGASALAWKENSM